MDYESFKEKFVEDLKDRLDEQGSDVKVSVNTVNKLNESYEAVTVTLEGSNIGVNIGIDKFYDAMENGRSYDEVVDKAVEVVNSGITQRPDFDIDSLSDCILRRPTASDAFENGHSAELIGQSRKHYSTVHLTRASIAYDVMAKRQGSVNAAFAMAREPIICYSCQEPFAA